MSASASRSTFPVARDLLGQPFSVAELKGTTVQLGEARYVLERLLGAGGMGEVYVAVRVMGDGPIEWRASEQVAIKVVRRDLAAVVGANAKPFEDEAQLHLVLDHPNIVRVRGVVEQDETLYLVMDYLEGRDLRALLKQAASMGRRLSEAAICNVLAQVADGLDYVHRAADLDGKPLHIVHRDVSPSNIRVTDSGEVKLMDFGVARFKREDRLETGSSERVYKGKLTYLSPEQANHQPTDGRSDLWAVGCILVEALTGKQPFDVGHDLLVLNAIRTVSPEFVEQVTPGVAPELKAICRKLLAFEATERYATGKELAAALRAYALERSYLLDSATLAAEVRVLERPLAEVTPTPITGHPEFKPVTVVRRPSAVVAGAMVLALAAGVLATAYFWRPPTPAPVEYVPMPAIEPLEPSAGLTPEPSPPPLKKALAPVAKKCLVAGVLVAASACPVRIPTTRMAGECTVVPVKEVQGEPLPEAIPVDFISLNGQECTGRSDDYPPAKISPCPVGEGTIIVQNRDDRDQLLVGRAHIVNRKETLHERWPPPVGRTREVTGRMIALFTELRLPGGKSFPICGALFDANSKEAGVRNPEVDLGPEGIPILDPKEFNGPSSYPGYTKVKLFWPKG